MPHLYFQDVLVPGQHIRHRCGISSPRASRVEQLPWKPWLWFPWQPAGVHTRLLLADRGAGWHRQERGRGVCGAGQGLAGAVASAGAGSGCRGWGRRPGAGGAGSSPSRCRRLRSLHRSRSGGLGASGCCRCWAVNKLLVAAEERRQFSTIQVRNAQN